MEALEDAARVAGVAGLIEEGGEQTSLLGVVEGAGGSPLGDLVADGVDPHAVFSHVEEAVDGDVEADVVARAQVLGDPVDARRQAVEVGDGLRVTAEGGEGRWPVASDVADVQGPAVGFPVVGDDLVAQRLGESRHDAAAGEEVEEYGRCALGLGVAEGAGDEAEQAALVAEVGDELVEEVRARSDGGVAATDVGRFRDHRVVSPAVWGREHPTRFRAGCKGFSRRGRPRGG